MAIRIKRVDFENIRILDEKAYDISTDEGIRSLLTSFLIREGALNVFSEAWEDQYGVPIDEIVSTAYRTDFVDSLHWLDARESGYYFEYGTLHENWTELVVNGGVETLNAVVEFKKNGGICKDFVVVNEKESVMNVEGIRVSD